MRNVWCAARYNRDIILFPSTAKKGDKCFMYCIVTKQVPVMEGVVVDILDFTDENFEQAGRLSNYWAYAGPMGWFFRTVKKSNLSEEDVIKMRGAPVVITDYEIANLPYEELGLDKNNVDAYDLLKLISYKYGRYVACQNAEVIGLSYNAAYEELFGK